jgi:glycosyltransferase involved in cell wall biosynthesis
LAKAVARVPSARLAVFARGDDYSQSEWDGAPLIRIPVMPYASLPELLVAADVVAIPQLNTEAAAHQMPMKVYDAMAMARPIVASTASDLPMVLEGCARLVPPGDVAGLTKAIVDLLEHPVEAEALGKAARARCLKHFTMEHVAQALSAAVKKAIEAHAAAP